MGKLFRNLSITILAVLVAVVLLPSKAWADKVALPAEDGGCGACGENGDNVTYQIYKEDTVDGVKYTITFSGSGKMFNYDEPAGNANEITPPWISWDISEATVGEGITSIGSFVFYEYGSLINNPPDPKYLESVELPSTLERIEDHAFHGANMANIELPDGLEYIGGFAFYKCESLKKIKIPSAVKAIYDQTFYGCSKLETIELHDDIGSIGESAFYCCDSLKEIEIPESVTTIGTGAFNYCESLKTISLPKDLNVDSVDGEFFKGMTGLETVKMPAKFKNVDKSEWIVDSYEEVCILDSNIKLIYVVDGGTCSADENDDVKYEITIDQSDNYILTISGSGNVAAYDESDAPWCNYNIQSVVIEDGVTGLGAMEFYNLTGLESVEMPESLTVIGEAAFSKCTALETVELPKKLKTLNKSVFADCDSLKKVIMPEGLEKIEEKAFYSCPKLDYKDIPLTVTYIGEQAFKKCSHFTEMLIPGSVITVGQDAFSECSALTELTCSCALKSQTATWGLGDNVKVVYCHKSEKVNTPEYLKTPATCTNAAEYYYTCSVCHEKLDETFTYGTVTGHVAKEVVTKPASATADGSYELKCEKCGFVSETHVIPRAYITVADTVKLNKKGSNAKVSVTDVNGKAIDSKYYTYSYSNNKKVGTAKVKIVFNAPYYTGTVTKKFTVADAKNIPSKGSLKSVSLKSKKLTVNWKKGKKPATGYEIQYSTDPKFLTGVKSAKVSKLATTKTTIKSCKEKCYYVRIRSFAKTKKYTAYGAWSSSKKVGK